MKIEIVNEAGYEEAVDGLLLSYKMFDYNAAQRYKLACKLAKLDNGHNKFLESMVMWLEIEAPRYWWQEFDTYRVGVTKQSESTMHTLTKRELTMSDFEGGIPHTMLVALNEFIKYGNLFEAKRALPESFLQRRMVCLNYKVLRHMIRQRRKHKLVEWRKFISHIIENCDYPEFLEGIYIKLKEE
jgi:hypothetical protein